MLNYLLELLGLKKEKVVLPKKAPVPEKEKEVLPPGNPVLEAALIEVAVEFENPDKFALAAQKIAEKLPVEQAEQLTNYFHKNTHLEPEYLKQTTAKYGIFGVWMSICQNAIMEIFYHYREQAIPVLYRVGFGVYDWTQYKAIDVLCRLAAEGLQTDQIVADIAENLPDFRFEAVMPSFRSLARIKNNEQVAKLLWEGFETYGADDDIDALHMLETIAIYSPDEARKKLDFIKEIALGRQLNTVYGGGYNADVIPKMGMTYREEYLESYRIFAATMFDTLSPGDAEITKLMDFWEHHAINEYSRLKIKEYRQKAE